jgi:hemerythrin-like domain-containing protein
MLTEHVEWRNYVKGYERRALHRLTPDDESAVGDILLNMQQYVDLLQAHIGKENNVLFARLIKCFPTTSNKRSWHNMLL